MTKTLAATLLLGSLVAAVPAPIEKRFNGPSDINRFRFFDTKNRLGVICDGDQGPDGATLWYEDLGASTIGRINYKTEQIDEWPIPYTTGPSGTPPFVGNVTALQCVVRLGKDNMLYAGAGTRNEIVRVNPRKNPPEIVVFAPPMQNPTGNLINFNDFWGSNSGMFFSALTEDLVQQFNYKTHSFTRYKFSTGTAPLGMRTDKDDNMWVTNFLGQYISKISKSNGAVTEYKTCCPPLSFPEVLRSSTKNQKYLWANAFGLGGYIRIEPAAPDALKFKYFQNPSGLGTFPFENVNDFCGRVWYTSPTSNILVYYTPSTDQWTTVTVPVTAGDGTGGGLPAVGNFEVIMHRNPGPYMWFSLGTVGRIGRYTLDASCFGEPQ